MQGRQKKLLTVAVVAALMIALTAGLAIAHKVRYSASINVKIQDLGPTPPATEPTTSQYSGKVNSSFARCERFRTVRITSTAGLFLQTATNLNGDYSITGPKQPQGVTVTATAPRKVLRKKRRHRHVCLPASQSHKAPK